MTLPINEVFTKENSKRVLLDIAAIVGGAALIVTLDQWTKSLVRDNIPFTQSWLPDSMEWLSPYARIVHWKNTGAAFGLFQDSNTFFIILAIVAAIFIIFYYPQVAREEWPLRAAMVLQLGGALGNLADRILIGSVTDFISVGSFPVFNIADSSISIGVAVLLIAVLIQEVKERRAKKDHEELSAEEPLSPEEPRT
ncbi:MAG: signal peptidase II [Chloroflexota bacterium]